MIPLSISSISMHNYQSHVFNYRLASLMHTETCTSNILISLRACHQHRFIDLSYFSYSPNTFEKHKFYLRFCLVFLLSQTLTLSYSRHFIVLFSEICLREYITYPRKTNKYLNNNLYLLSLVFVIY